MGAEYTDSAGGIVVNAETGLVLVVEQNTNAWSLPKGHIEKDEYPVDAAKREIFEEAGISELELISELGKYKRFKIGEYTNDDRSEIKSIRMFLFTTTQRHPHSMDECISNVQWVPREEVADMLRHVKDREFFLKHIDKLPVPVEQDN